MCVWRVGEGEGPSASFVPQWGVDRTRPLPGGLPSIEPRGWAHGVLAFSLLPGPCRVTRLASEKRELEAQLGRSREEALAGRAARQEAETLRRLVRELELELRQERGLGARAGARSQDCRRLAKEVRGRRQGGGPAMDLGLVRTAVVSASLRSSRR